MNSLLERISGKNAFAVAQKIIVQSVMCIALCILFTNCGNQGTEEYDTKENEMDHDMISSNLLEIGDALSFDPNLLIGEWESVKFAYTLDGNKISNVANISNCQITIADAILWYEDDELPDHEIFLYFKVCSYAYSRSGNNGNNIKFIHEKSACFAIEVPWTNDEMEVDKALRNVYYFVFINNELIIYFTGDKNKNLLIFKKR